MANQNELREEITARIVECLKNGTKPWVRPWSSDPNCGLPANVVSKKKYTGINPLLLEATAMAKGYTSRWWGTYRQWSALGGQVMKRPDDVPAGRWGTPIVFWSAFEKTKETDDGIEAKKIPFMKSYTVFNLNQVSGAALDHLRPGNADVGEVDPSFDFADEVIDMTRADIRHGGDRAFYRRPVGDWPHHSEGDFITVPNQGLFRSTTDYYSTVFHELVHWSEVRLGWKGSYALGELVAEIGATFLCGSVGIELGQHFDSHASYLVAWIKELEDDNRAIFRAAAQASKAADLILKFSRQEEVEPEVMEVSHEA